MLVRGRWRSDDGSIPRIGLVLLLSALPAVGCTRVGYFVPGADASAASPDGGPAINRTWCDGLAWIEAACETDEIDARCVTLRSTSCDDGNPCTDDACLPRGGCESRPNQGPCPPPDPCSSVGLCREATCVAGPIDRDQDADGYIDAACSGGDDCDDRDPRVHPQAVEASEFGASCWDLRDNDCDGLLDENEENCAPRRWRSVGVAAGDLNSGQATLQIAADRATFDRALPDAVGVGDVLQYATDGSPRLALIHGRLGPASFVVRDRAGALPAPCPAGTAVSIFRAYTSLTAWQQQEENPRIDDAVRDFDRDRDLVAARAVMHVACYDDGPDLGNPTVSGWVTSPTYHVHIMSPRAPHEVGASQRHRGTYGGYRLEPAAAGITLAIAVAHVRVEGLSIRGWPGGSNTVRVSVSAANVDLSFTHNVVDSNGNGDNNGTVQILATAADAAGRVRVANNVVYGTPVAWSECIWLGNYENYAPLSYVLLNNSVVNCYRGYEARSTLGRVLAKNNLAVASGAVDFFDNPAGSFDAASSHNCTSDATGAAIGTSAVTGVDPSTIYVSATPGQEDLHLMPGSACQGRGLNLHGDPQFSIEEDFEGDPRPPSGAWDIGADQLVGAGE